METQLVRLEDGILVEAAAVESRAQPLSGKLAREVSASFGNVGPIILKAAQSVGEVWRELNKDMLVDEAEIEFGISFEGEGNIYITKAKAGANLVVKLTLKPLGAVEVESKSQ